jgi:hypothetical protein
VLSLLDLGTAPATSFEYAGRMAEIRMLLFQSYSYAMRTQTLIQTAIRTVEHILSFMGHISEAIGNLTVSQSLGEAHSKLTQLATEANVRQAAFERAESIDAVAPALITESLRNIGRERMADHPR